MRSQIKALESRKDMTLPYEIFISILALVAVGLSLVDSSNNLYVKVTNSIILMVFAIDYIVRLIFSEDRYSFLKENILDLIAIFPFNSVFRAFRIVRLFKLLRLTKALKIFRVFNFSKKFHSSMKRFLKTNGFIYMIYTTIAIIAFGSILIYIIEKGNVIHSMQDAVWLSFSSLAQFGYEGVELMSLPGKIIVGVLVATGICFTGMFTATMATYFLKLKIPKEAVENKIIDLSDLSEEQFKEVVNFISFTRAKG